MHYSVIVDRLRAAGDAEAADRLAGAYETIDVLYAQLKAQGEIITKYDELSESVRVALENLVGAASDCVVPTIDDMRGPIVEITSRKRDIVDLNEAHAAGRAVLRKWWPADYNPPVQ
jgi:hypothetical protein